VPITGSQLEAGDLLFKNQTGQGIQPLIVKKQTKQVMQLATTVGMTSIGTDVANFTHVALAVGPDDVMEFDEGGLGIKILKRGEGFVRGNMTMQSRRNVKYDVMRCTIPELQGLVKEKAEMLWDLSQSDSPIRGNYSLRKLAIQGVKAARGRSFNLPAFEAKLNRWLQADAEGGRILAKKPTMNFFCSEFATFVYMWASCYLRGGSVYRVFGLDFLLGIDKYRLSPVELYTRIETVGAGSFQFKGNLYN
jgi:hypothetical protein